LLFTSEQFIHALNICPNVCRDVRGHHGLADRDTGIEKPDPSVTFGPGRSYRREFTAP
jgi:hypothetical protein